MTARFIGEVHTEWLKNSGDDRQMRLLQDFVFVDAYGTEWVAPTGHRIDGASIPSILWSLSGSPFVGDYRRASVIHDVYCVTKSRPHRAVHKMFYEAMLCDGVDLLEARKFYTAVRLFGPTWRVAEETASSADLPGLENADFYALEAACDLATR